MPRLTVCGLGPGGHDQLTEAARAAIERCDVRFLRTARHPSASLVPDATTFDELYEQAESFAEVYEQIAERLVEAAVTASTNGTEVLYAVPGSPLVLEESVRRLRADDRVELELVASLSFLDEVWARLGVDPVDDGVRLVDGHRFAAEAAGQRGPLLIAHAHAPWVLSDIKLASDAGLEQRAIVLQRLGTPEENIVEVGWPDLDRLIEPDHLTSIYVPELAAPVAGELVATVELMHRLRQECAWDQAQDHASLRKFLLEETYEVLEAIDGVVDQLAQGSDGTDGGDGLAESYQHLEEELGDLWFQILFHAELATEAGQFSVADVARTIKDKLIGRHPHVFGEVSVGDDPAQIEANWEAIKRAEKQRESALDGIPGALPSLTLAAKYLQRADRSGVPADLGPLGEQLAAELDEADPDAVGRWLLAVVEVARLRDVDAEDALRRAAGAALQRFQDGERGDGPTPAWALGQ